MLFINIKFKNMSFTYMCKMSTDDDLCCNLYNVHSHMTYSFNKTRFKIIVINILFFVKLIPFD